MAFYQNFKAKLSKGYDWLFGAMIISLPFSTAIPNIAFVALIIIFLMHIKEAAFETLKNKSYIALVLLWSYLIVKAAIVQDLAADFSIYSRFTIFLIMPVLLTQVVSYKKIFNALIISATLLIVLSLYKILAYYFKYNLLPINYGYDVNKLLLIERPYAGFLAVLCCILSLKMAALSSRKYLAIYIITAVLSVFYIFFISARISAVTLMLIMFIYLFFYFKGKNIRKTFWLLSVVAVIGTVFALNTNIAERFFIKDDLNASIERASGSEPRIVIWGCAYDIANSEQFNPFFGIGSYHQIENEYLACYQNTIEDQQKKVWFLDIKFNSHNQYIDLYLIGGIVAIILIVAFFSFSLFKLRKHFFEFSIMLAFVLFFAVENVLHRQLGCYIFSIFATMFMMNKYFINDKN